MIELRHLLKEVAFWKYGAMDRLIFFLYINGHDHAAYHARQNKDWPGEILAYFGIHRCSGCGGDPEEYHTKHKETCKQCNGSCWMHEVSKGIVGFDPGMFGPTEEGWQPKWSHVLHRDKGR